MTVAHSAGFPETNRYRIVRKLGKGGSSAVFLARDRLEASREVALKLSHQRIAPDEILREFRVLRELRNSGIARALDFGRIPTTGQAYFTMEYVRGIDLEKKGPSLRRQFQRGNQSPLLVAFARVARTLDHLHRHGLLHLDIKPANIVFSDSTVKLIDFGLFQNVHAAGSVPARGTARYCAPEVFDGGAVDLRADLYSFGVTLFYTLVGSYPIGGRNIAEISRNHRNAAPRPLKGIPAPLERIVFKLLAKSPRDRFQDAAELSCALEDLLDDGDRSNTEPYDGLAFVGRKRELDVLFSWLDRERTGAGPRLLVVEGDHGIGKTRFLDACITEFLALDVEVISAAQHLDTPLGGLAVVVQKILTISPDAAKLRRKHRFLLTYLGLSANEACRREIAHSELGSTRARVFREAVDLMAGALQRPMLLVLDDIHRSDGPTRDFLRRLTWEDQDPGRSIDLGVIVACRSAGEDLPEANRAGFETIRLPALRKKEAFAALEVAVPGLGRRLVGELAAASHGNPGELDRLARRALDGSTGEPTSVDAAMPVTSTKRLAENPGHRGVLLALGVLGRPASESFLARLTGLGRARLRTAERELARSGFLRRGDKGYFLDQGLLAGPWKESFSPEEVRETHRRIGRQLAENPTYRFEAAPHLLLAGEYDAGLEAARCGVRELLKRGRVEEALVLCRQAAQHAADRETRGEFLEQVGDLHQTSGQFDDAARVFDQLLEDLPNISRARVRVLRKRGGIYQRSGESVLAERAFADALRLLESFPWLEEHLQLLNELAGLHLFRGDFAAASACARHGLELLRAGRDSLEPAVRESHALNLHSVAGQVLLRQREYDRAADEYVRSLEHAKGSGIQTETALILNNLGVAYHQGNRIAEATRVYRRATRLARERRDDTALFSIRCNFAGIRARRGEIHGARDLLDEVEAMPHQRRSRRARLFFLHAKGLVERVALADALEIWSECIELADELSDPLYSTYARVNLLENEIVHGRWAAARAALDELGPRAKRDLQVERSVAARRLYLDALCGNVETAMHTFRSTFVERGTTPEREERPHYGMLWDWIFAAAGLLEIGEFDRAEAWLRRTREFFARSRQFPGALECSLLLADLHLRLRRFERASSEFSDVRAAIGNHDRTEGSRGAPARLAFLEARAASGEGGGRRTPVLRRLAEARASMPVNATWEIVWLIEFLGAECDEPGTRWKEARSRFVRALTRADRESYLRRDPVRRLGLGSSALGDVSHQSEVSVTAQRRLETLIALRATTDETRLLDPVLESCGARRGAVFLASGGGHYRDLDGGDAADLARLAAAALELGSGPLERGQCVALRLPEGKRLGVLFIETPPVGGEEHSADARGHMTDTVEFLELAAEILCHRLTELEATARRKPMPTTPLVASAQPTQSLWSSAFVGARSRRMQEILSLLRRTRESSLPVLLEGESGSGKDYLARWIHASSPRRERSFLALDCSVIPENLFEAELFGYEAGAFTGAERARDGYLLAANGGTLYLDHVDALPVALQTKLLTVLESETLRPLGSSTSIRIDARLIASTQSELTVLCERGEFRKDFYYRLAGICLALPPLRERIEDLGELIRHFAGHSSATPVIFSSSAMDVLRSYSWPGNVRQLESFLRRVALTAESPVQKETVLRALGSHESTSSFPRWIFEGRQIKELLGDVKREYLLHLFERFDGDMDRIAAELGASKRTAYHQFLQAGLRLGEMRTKGDESAG